GRARRVFVGRLGRVAGTIRAYICRSEFIPRLSCARAGRNKFRPTRNRAPSAVRRPLRLPLRRVFPIFLSAVRREIEEVVRREELVEAARVRGVRVIDIALVAYEYAVHRMVAFERLFREARSQ